MKILWIILPLLSSIALAQNQAGTPQRIYGHQIGETVLQFISVENAASLLTNCHDLLVEPKLEKNERKSVVVRSKVESCLRLAAIVKTGSGTIGAGEISFPLPGELSFQNNRLVLMAFSVSQGYDDSLRDFRQKFGATSREWSDEFQNGFGAKFNYRRAAWDSSTIAVTLSEMQDQAGCAVTAEDPQYALEVEKEKESNHRNVIDR